MPNYNYGKIYKIVSKDSNLIYIGSTVCSLKKRMNEHRCNMLAYIKDENYSGKQDSWKLLIFEDAEIHLIEKYPCSSKRELEERERYNIEKVGLDWVVNERLPAPTKEEKKRQIYESGKRIRNNRTTEEKEEINRKIRERYANDEEYRNKKNEYNRQRNKDFKAEKAQSDKKYKENNRGKVNANNRLKWFCECCNKEISKGNKHHHLNTKIHKQNLCK